MRERKYTLPRHTNLASEGPRIGAFLIDLAITLAITLGLFFGCFSFIFKNKTDTLQSQIKDERIASGLFVETDEGLSYCSALNDNQQIIDHLYYFYTVYIPYECKDKDSNVVLSNKKEVTRQEYFTTEWFNKNILRIETDGELLFEYVKNGDLIDFDTLGVMKSTASSDNINSYLRHVIADLADPALKSQPYYKKINNEYGFYYSLEFVISALIGGAVTYIVFPIVLKNGATVGKKVFGLGLANSDGYKMKNSQLAMRFMPYTVFILALLIPIWKSLSIPFVVLAAVFLVSSSIAMASPKKSSLHDFCARTIVVDTRTSILFDNFAEEEVYLRKEEEEELSREHK